MDSYGEIRRMYRGGSSTGAGAGTATAGGSSSRNVGMNNAGSTSPTRARKEHLRLRNNMFSERSQPLEMAKRQAREAKRNAAAMITGLMVAAPHLMKAFSGFLERQQLK